LVAPQHLHTFPTRRSSDLIVRGAYPRMVQPLNATLTEGNVARQLRVMAVPMVWGLMATMSLNLVDTFFIARLGRAPLAALSFTLDRKSTRLNSSHVKISYA